MLIRAALVSLLLALPAAASAQAVRVISTTPHGATSDVVIEGDLAQVSAAISAGADAQLRQIAPQVYTPIDIGVVRYHDTSTTIESITYRRVSDTELGVTIRAQVRSSQEHRTLTLAWEDDGLVHLATVTLEARVTLAFTEAGGVHAVVVGDTATVQPQLTGLDVLGSGAPIPLGGRTLGERTVEENPIASRHLRGTAVAIESVTGFICRMHVTAVAAH